MSELNEQESQKEENDSAEVEKIQKINKEKQELIYRILSGNLQTKHDQVGFILNHYTKARNSDVELAWLYWKTFESDKFNGKYITKGNLEKLTKINSLTRSRARIQNEYKLFQADDIVKRYRGVLSEEKKKEAIEEKPVDLPIYYVHLDETGKTQDYLSIGSLWVFDGRKSFISTNKIKSWKREMNIEYEFHFSEVKGHKLDAFKEFFLMFLKLNPTVCFKVIVIDRKGLKQINQVITDLTFHLIYKGIQQENRTARAPLPRLLQVWIDREESGSDQLKIENLKERLNGQNEKGLYLGDFEAVDSKDNFSIQAVDLFTAAVNRRLHGSGKSENAKDELANYILELLSFDPKTIDFNETECDRLTVFNLSYRE